MNADARTTSRWSAAIRHFERAARLAGLSLLGACGSTASQAAAAGDGGGAKPPSPTDLRQFESLAEAMSESARGTLPNHVPDWATAASAHDSANVLWLSLKPVIQRAGAAPGSISAIDAALSAYGADLARGEQRTAETDANAITRAVPDVFDAFTYPAPTDTLRLDGTFRQLQIDAEFADWPACARDLADTTAVWARLRGLVAAQAPNRPDIMGSAMIATDVDATLRAIGTLVGDAGGRDVTSLEDAAQVGLDETDTCEQIFK